MFGHLTLDVPDMEARDMELHPAPRRFEMLEHRLGVGHGLAAAIAGLPGARAATDERDGGGWQAAVGELFLNQETKEGLLHGDLPKVRISPVRGPANASGQDLCRRYVPVMFEPRQWAVPGDSLRVLKRVPGVDAPV